MKWIDDIAIIGIDTGYGNIKTANCCFEAGVLTYDTEPIFKENMLAWNGKYYLVGQGHMEFKGNKVLDDDYYVLTLAAIARELSIQGIDTERVRIAAGLPLTWVQGQRDEFKKYLMQNKYADFNFRGKDYYIEIVDVDIFPQGFAAVADKLREFRGTNVLCDIGNGTMNIMYIIDGRPQAANMFTEKYGTHQCMLAVKENIMREHQILVPDSVITGILRFGTADINDRILETIRRTATEYVDGIFRILRSHEYSAETMKLYVVGGGGCLIKNFGSYDKDHVTIREDICATAKGYEYLAEVMINHSKKAK